MNIAWLREFVVLADTLSYFEAAERLYMGQSTLSKHIKALEQELGVQLFERTSRKVLLSRAGTMLLPYARAEVDAHYALEAAVRNYFEQQRGKVVFACIPALQQYGITDIIVSFRSAYPQYTLQIEECDSALAERKLLEGQCELAFFRCFPEQERSKLTERIEILAKDELVAVLPSAHPLAKQQPLRLEQLRRESFVAFEDGGIFDTLLHSLCASSGFCPYIAFNCHRLGSVLNLVAKGMGVALLPVALTNFTVEDIAVGRLTNTVSTSVEICWKKNILLSRAAQAFIDCAKDTLTPS